jgi:hypothetical protein
MPYNHQFSHPTSNAPSVATIQPKLRTPNPLDVLSLERGLGDWPQLCNNIQKCLVILRDKQFLCHTTIILSAAFHTPSFSAIQSKLKTSDRLALRKAFGVFSPKLGAGWDIGGGCATHG